MQIALTSGAYSSRSIIANAQRCLNLFPEVNPQETKPPVPMTHYPRPGKKQLAIPPILGLGRGMYRATNGELYCAVGTKIFHVDSAFNFTALGDINDGTSIVSMADNGQDVGDNLVIVDGSSDGWQVTMSTQAFAPIVDGTGTFVGANRVDYLNGFFLFNAPVTPYWYISLLNQVAFDALDVASKASYADNIATLGVRQREVWLIGRLTTEPWYLSGAPDFPFEAIQSALVPYGCIATYSMQPIDSELYWISQDLKGSRIVVRSEGYKVKRISTHAIETEFQSYADVSDAIGTSYQIQGHTFYVLSFPTANKTWAFDLATEQWHELCFLDTDGGENRDRAVVYVNAYDKVLGQDWETGIIYEIDANTYTDNGLPIKFLRGFPHVLNEMKRVTHWSLVADIQCGTQTQVDDDQDDPILLMRYSDDRGQSYSDYVEQTLGRTGQYDTSPQFTRLGYARDRVYELSWSAAVKTALNGVYIETEPHQS